MLEQLLAWDKSLFLVLNLMGSTTYDPLWLWFSEKSTNAVVYLLFVVIYGNKKGWKSAFFLLLIASLLVGVTDQVTNLFKDGFGRLRPCYTPEIQGIMRLVKASCGGQFGFFSGHASNSFALAMFFSRVFQCQKWIMPMLLTFAAFIAYSRVYIGVHYPLDILCGSILGIVNAFVFYWVISKMSYKYLPNF